MKNLPQHDIIKGVGKYIRITRGRVEYKPYIRAEKRHLFDLDSSYKIKKPYVLGRDTDPIQDIIKAYAKAKADVETRGTVADHSTINWLIAEYKESHKFKSAPENTREDYRQKLKVFTDTPIKAEGSIITVGDMRLEEITQPRMQKILKRIKEGYEKRGADGSHRSNGSLRVFGAVIDWARNWYEQEELHFTGNPCNGLEWYSENKRDNLIMWESYEIQIAVARKYSPDYFPLLMELQCRLAGRSIEVPDLEWTDLTDIGIDINRRKRSKSNTIRWDELGAMDHIIKELWALREDPDPKNKRRGSKYVVSNTSGKKITRSAMSSALERLRKKMVELGKGEHYWILHDLKRLGVTEAPDPKIAGQSKKQMKDYDLRREVFDAPAIPLVTRSIEEILGTTEKSTTK